VATTIASAVGSSISKGAATSTAKATINCGNVDGDEKIKQQQQWCQQWHSKGGKSKNSSIGGSTAMPTAN